MTTSRQRIRKALILVSFLLFPITINYFSPYVIIDGAAQGIVNGSLIVFSAMLLSALFVGRLWCGWACPAGGLQEACFAAASKPARGGRLDWIKWGIWFVWISVIVAMVLNAGGYTSVDFFHLTDGGISVARPEAYLIYYTVVGLVVILSLSAGRRAFCHYICWMAPFMIIGRAIRNLGKWPSLQLHTEEKKCVACGRCSKYCPASLDVKAMVQEHRMENSECILCGTCVDVCPKGVIHYAFGSVQSSQGSSAG